jgi:hypothetical protein
MFEVITEMSSITPTTLPRVSQSFEIVEVITLLVIFYAPFIISVKTKIT